MTETHTVRIDIPHTASGYDILVVDGLLTKTGAQITQRLGKRQCLVVTDSNVAPLYLDKLQTALTDANLPIMPPIIVPAGEQSKSWSSIQDLLAQFFDRGVDRKTLIIALGGGVIGDLTGFAASIALRGLDFVQIPTTLLSQVDSSVGGKTGINASYGKNTIGAFYQPKLVLADVSTLDTLPTRQILSGYGEVVKYGLIHAPDFFEWCCRSGRQLTSGNPDLRIHAISQSCQYKARIVAEDEREAGRRALLNLGHTFGHALESVTGYSDALLHGEAVAIGTLMAFDLSVALGLCPEAEAQKVRTHFETMGLPTEPPKGNYTIDDLMALMGQDKKAVNGKLTLVLAKGIGQAFIAKDVQPEPIRALWEKALA